MNKISIVCERNEETKQVHIKTIVLFKDGEEPIVKEYDGILDLMPVVEFAAANGVDLVGEAGIAPGLESGLLNIMVSSNKKAMAELRAEILEARVLSHARNLERAENLERLEEEITNEADEMEKVPAKVLTPGRRAPVEAPEIEPASIAERMLNLPPESRGALGDNPVLRRTDEHFNENRGSLGQDSRFRGPASMHGAPTERNSAFHSLGEESEMVPADTTVETPEVEPASIAERMLNLPPESRGALGDNPVLRRTDEHFNDNRASLGTDSRFRRPASMDGAPTERNSALHSLGEEPEFVAPESTEELSRVMPISEIEIGPRVERPTILPRTSDSSKEEKPEIIPSSEESELKPVILPIISGINKEDKPEMVDPAVTEEKSEIVESKAEPTETEENEIEIKKARRLSDDEDLADTIKRLEEEEKITIRPTSRIRNFFKKTGAFLLGALTGILGTLGLADIIHRNKKSKLPAEVPPTIIQVQQPTVPPTQQPTQQPTQPPTKQPTLPPTQRPTETPVGTKINHQRIINAFINNNKVPHGTQLFLHRPEVLGFLSIYQNEAQLNEVLSALSYGFESNILCTKNGNFRLDADGNNYLHSFTKDFMSAKALVNNYDSKQLLTLFGGKDITYEILINGFQNYCHTIMTYGMTATESLPFHYLTNNNLASTSLMNDLFGKLIEVNRNRDNGTLTSKHTDDFIAKTFNIFVENNQSTNVSEATKTVLAAMVDSFVMMQSNVAGGKALYLHEDRGYAKAGINLAEVDGQFTFRHKDKTTYEFTSLFDVMNHEYGNKNDRCVLEQERMISQISAMQSDTTTSTREARERLAKSLYNNGLGIYAEAVLDNKVDENLLLKIQKANPVMMQDVEVYRNSVQSNKDNLVGFQRTYETIDGMLGIHGRSNPYNNLINVRRARALTAKYNLIGGKTNTKTPTQPQRTPAPVVTTQTEQVTKEEMSVVEQLQAQQEENRLRREEEEAHRLQQQKIEEAKVDLREGVQEGKTQAELEQIAEESGITLDPDYQKNMEEALRQQQEGEQRRLQELREIEERNAQAERDAAERRRQEEEEQRRRQEEEAALIAQSTENNDQTNPDLTGEDEIPYVPESKNQNVEPEYDPQLDPNLKTEDEMEYNPSSTKEQLEELKSIALATPVELDIKILKKVNRNA